MTCEMSGSGGVYDYQTYRNEDGLHAARLIEIERNVPRNNVSVMKEWKLLLALGVAPQRQEEPRTALAVLEVVLVLRELGSSATNSKVFRKLVIRGPFTVLPLLGSHR